MDPFYAFLLFVVVLALDLLAGQTWLAFYYRLGLPIFSSRRDWTSSETAGERPVGSAESLADKLAPGFKGQPEHPSIRFKALNDRQVAFRELLFENRGGGRYLPVMHSILRLHPERRSLSVTGYVNGYVVVALAYLLYRAWMEPSFIPVAALILIIFGLIYAAQAGVSRRVAQAASQFGQ